MPNICGCTGDASPSRLLWPWRKQNSNARLSAAIGESVDDSELSKSLILAKPEVDEPLSSRNSIPTDSQKSSRPPVTFELNLPSRCEQERGISLCQNDLLTTPDYRSPDIEVGNNSQASCEANRQINRTFPYFFNTKPTRNSTHRYPSHNAIPIRRGSLIVRSGRPFAHGMLNSQQSVECKKQMIASTSPGTVKSPIAGDGYVAKDKFLDESTIVTPFAQILAGLRSVQTNLTWLTKTAVSAEEPGGLRNSNQLESPAPKTVEANERLAAATERELEWCLQQLENIQTKRPVSDMASSKFKRLLSQKLGSFRSSDKTRNQISEYISKTFMDEYSEHDENDDESSNTLATGNEVAENSRTDITGYSIESSACEIDLHARSRLSSGEQPESHSGFQHPSVLSSIASAASSDDAPREHKSNMLPMLGIPTSNDETLHKKLDEDLNTWRLNMFDVDSLSGQHSLTVVAYQIFTRRNLFSTFNIDPTTFVKYILRLEASYQSSNPYHNHVHGADVLQAVHVLIQAETLEGVFTDLEILSTLYASAIHDVHHPGLTNQFLVNTGHKLALLYNDASVLENHHLSVAFKLLTESGCDIFANLATKQRQILRRLVIELVLATDMSKHMNLLAELRTMVETKELTGTGFLSLDNHNDRSLVLQCMLHCADLNNPTKPFEIYKQWTIRVMEEFFQQGDKEKELGLEVSAMCDRDSVVVDKAQIGFIDFVIHPLWDTWCDLVHPAAEHILETLDNNRDIISNQSPFKEFKERAKRKTPNLDSERPNVRD